MALTSSQVSSWADTAGELTATTRLPKLPVTRAAGPWETAMGQSAQLRRMSGGSPAGDGSPVAGEKDLCRLTTRCTERLMPLLSTGRKAQRSVRLQRGDVPEDSPQFCFALNLNL